MISYEPLLNALKNKNISIRRLQKDLGISSRTTSKFSKGGSVTLETIEKICLYLDLPIEQVVRIEKDEK